MNQTTKKLGFRFTFKTKKNCGRTTKIVMDTIRPTLTTMWSTTVLQRWKLNSRPNRMCRLDGDGVSNLNDLWPFDKSQALDTDGDSYGDNPDGIDGDACPDVAGIAGGDGGNGCPPADDDGDGVSNALDDCPNTVAGTAVGPDGCEKDTPIDEPTNPVDPTNPDQNQTDTNQTVVDDDSTQNSGDDGSTDTDATQSESGVLGMSFTHNRNHRSSNCTLGFDFRGCTRTRGE